MDWTDIIIDIIGRILSTGAIAAAVSWLLDRRRDKALIAHKQAETRKLDAETQDILTARLMEVLEQERVQAEAEREKLHAQIAALTRRVEQLEEWIINQGLTPPKDGGNDRAAAGSIASD